MTCSSVSPYLRWRPLDLTGDLSACGVGFCAASVLLLCWDSVAPAWFPVSVWFSFGLVWVEVQSWCGRGSVFMLGVQI